MRLEEERLEEETKKEEKEKMAKLKEKAANEFTDTVNKQRFQRLNFLIEKSTLYANFLAKKLEKQQQDARDKASAEEAKRETERAKEAAGVKGTASVEEPTVSAASTRSSARHITKPEQPSAAPPKKKEKHNAVAAKKRKPDDAHYDIADYLDKDVLKKQKQTEVIETSADTIAPLTKPAISARQPRLVTGGVLRDYQLAGVEWMISLYENGLNGILADEMGLGKTLQTIAFLAYLREKGVWGPFLVVAPLSTLANWVMEFERFVPGIPVELYHGTPDEREHKRNHKLKKLDSKFPIVVTSYEIVVRDRKYLSKYQWKYIIVDEGHRLKNMDCKLIRELKSYHSANRMLLTGTPLQNNLSELWSLLNFLLPDIFDDREGFEEWFDFSDINAKEGQDRILGEESQSGIVSSLHHILKPFLLRRVKTDVEHSLPKKREYLLYAPLTLKQKEWHDAVLGRDIRNFLIQKKCGFDPSKSSKASETKTPESTDASDAEEDADEAINHEELDAIIEAEDEQKEKDANKTGTVSRRTRGAVKSYVEKSDKVYFQDLEAGKETEKQTDQDLVTAREVDIRKASKSITNMKLMNVVMQLRKVCNHPFLFDWPLDPKTNMPVLSEDLLNESGKMLVLNRLLDALFKRGHKVLIFSQFTTMLDIIQDWAEIYKGWVCCRIDGGVPQDERRRQIGEFNKNPELKLFLLSTRAGGLGINLTSADTVIIFDSDWNPQMDLQAQDRVHRIGQTRPVIIYRLVTANTVEGKIIERASSKRKLEKLVIHKGKFKQPPTSNSLASDRATTLADLAEILAQDDGEKIQLATKDDVVISDKHLEMLLDRSDAAYETNGATAVENETAIFKAVNEVRDDQNDVLKVDKMAAAV
ncbi:SNF2 family N-terminal domain-containing protein [Dissophora ornata]|nr:SNF2 family N-terminal domain-containing protein [Dissophora ornata]